MLIPMPAAPIAANIEWTLDQPGQVNRSEFTGRRKVTILAAAPSSEPDQWQRSRLSFCGDEIARPDIQLSERG